MDRALAPLAKKLRKRPTEAEKLLWRHLRAKQLGGLKFRRQQVLGSYIVDFVCLEKRLVIELDGGQHAKNQERARDHERDRWLREEGFTVIRAWNHEVLTNLEGVLELIRSYCESPSP